jgi:hypothetical protein
MWKLSLESAPEFGIAAHASPHAPQTNYLTLGRRPSVNVPGILS